MPTRTEISVPKGASMRPGQSCPGVAGGSLPRGGWGYPGFNEAGAIMPRSGPGYAPMSSKCVKA